MSTPSRTKPKGAGPAEHISLYVPIPDCDFIPPADTTFLEKQLRQGIVWAHRLTRVDHPFDVSLCWLEQRSEQEWQKHPRRGAKLLAEERRKMTHPPQLRERAERMRREGMLVKDVAHETGVSQATVVRWSNPEFEERERQRARKRKYSKLRKCANCNRRVANNATLCKACYKKKNLEERPWPRERVIESIQRWAAENGAPPKYEQWLKSGGDRHPSMWTVVRGPNPVFPSWSEALDAAGFGHWKRKSRLTREERATIRRDLREKAIKEAVAKNVSA